MRSTTHRRTQYTDDDDLADPRPWETRVPPSKYGSGAHEKSSSADSALPLYSSMDSEKEKLLERDTLSEKIVVTDDDQGKWNKGHGAGPGIGGRRGLPPRQRIEGWVSFTYNGPPC